MLARKAIFRIKAIFNSDLSQLVKGRIHDYIVWWTLMAVYSVGLLTLGILIDSKLQLNEQSYMAMVLRSISECGDIIALSLLMTQAELYNICIQDTIEH